MKEAGVCDYRIRSKMYDTAVTHGKSQPLGAVTVSIGLSAFSPALDSAEAIVRAADRALYHAKRHGKNRAYAYQGASGAANGAAANPQQGFDYQPAHTFQSKPRRVCGPRHRTATDRAARVQRPPRTGSSG